jgi:protein-tyrosine phosphatase
MVRMASEAGTTDIVASPHADLEYAFDPQTVERAIAELQRSSEAAVRIHYGCDFHLHYENVRDALAHPSRYAINHLCYVLVEVPELMPLRTAEEIMGRMRSSGMALILTHPERHSLVRRQLDKLEQWVAEGCYVQLTAQSLLGKFGNKAQKGAREMLERGLAHFVASDAHDVKQRTPRLDGVRRWIAREYGDETAERLLDRNPAAVLTGSPLPAGANPVARRGRWSRLFSHT